MWIFSQLLKKEKDIAKLLTDISSQQEKHQRLQETKAALDMEIAVYKKLLETEEDRLDIGQGETDHHMNTVMICILDDAKKVIEPPDICRTAQKGDSVSEKRLTVAQTLL